MDSPLHKFLALTGDTADAPLRHVGLMGWALPPLGADKGVDQDSDRFRLEVKFPRGHSGKPNFLQAEVQIFPISTLSPLESFGAGVSSIIFWCLLWIEQSLSPK